MMMVNGMGRNCGDRKYLMDLWARFGIHENDGINIWTRWQFFFACVFFFSFSLWEGFFVGYKYKHTHTQTYLEKSLSILASYYFIMYGRLAKKISTYIEKTICPPQIENQENQR